MQLHPATVQDAAFLEALYVQVNAHRFALLAPAMAEPLLRMQAQAQARGYAESWPDSEQLVVWVDGERAGQLRLQRGPERLHMVDMSVSPPRQGKGLGRMLIEWVREQANGSPVTLRVLQGNRAQRLYERQGFQVIDQQPPYLLMQMTTT